MPVDCGGNFVSTARRVDVSVVRPTCNREDLVIEAIESALEQRDVVVEVIVVDDSSTDNTIEKVTHRFGRSILLIPCTSNMGACYCRNIGLSIATGRYLRFLDSDDLLHPTSSALIINEMERHRADIGFGHWQIMKGGLLESPSDSEGMSQVDDTDSLVSLLLAGKWNAPFAYLYRRESITGIKWDVALCRDQDFDFILQAAIETRHAVFIDVPT